MKKPLTIILLSSALIVPFSDRAEAAHQSDKQSTKGAFQIEMLRKGNLAERCKSVINKNHVNRLSIYQQFSHKTVFKPVQLTNGKITGEKKDTTSPNKQKKKHHRQSESYKKSVTKDQPIERKVPVQNDQPTAVKVPVQENQPIEKVEKPRQEETNLQPIKKEVQQKETQQVKEPSKVEEPTTQQNMSAIEQEVLKYTNNERQKAGLAPLKIDQKVMATARAKSADMSRNNYFSHNSPTYGSPFDQMKAGGVQYRAAAENIAMGQRSAQEVVQSWMKSPGHRQNILSPQFTHIGIGYDANGHYWTQQFIQK